MRAETPAQPPCCAAQPDVASAAIEAAKAAAAAAAQKAVNEQRMQVTADPLAICVLKEPFPHALQLNGL